ncbi:MAG TPA: tetratricopeptide repeat protein [Kofleriaceae bacterium]|nr:tetratricopeptide repeat protein [Kofleriaceae bacterium]
MADQNDLLAAIEAAKSEPGNGGAWDAVEDLAGELDAPDAVAAAYRSVLNADLDRELVLELGERAAQFHEEWYSDDPSGLIHVLTCMLEVDPGSTSAFQRLTVVFTVAERWSDLLGLYDDTIAAVTDDARRIRLLDEAAQVAKDVAGQPEKAIEYLQRLLPLRPDDSRLAQNLERLLERHEHWRELIALWQSLLEDQRGAEREGTLLRIATCWMNDVGDPGEALNAVKALLAEASDDAEACALLERILQADASNATVRAGALALLRGHYESTERPREVVRVLSTAIELADGPPLQGLHEEAAERLADLGDDAGAMTHYAALLALDPGSSVTQEQLRQLAQRSGNYDAYARGVAAAAEASSDVSRKVALLAEAARTRLDYLDDEAGAIDLLKGALAHEGVSDADLRVVTRRLGELLASADRPAERLDVLERLAGVESSDSRRRAVLGEVARLAESVDEPDRALTAWRTRIELDPSDDLAMDAMVSLLERTRRWEPLIEALQQRVARIEIPRERKSDLVRIATVYETELADVGKAIDAWLRVQRECGEDAENIDALTNLLARAERWAEMAELLHRVSARESQRITSRLAMLADAQRAHLGAPAEAMEAYRQALLIDSRHEEARQGLTQLLEDETHRAGAAGALTHAYRENREWDRFLSLVEPRLAQAADDPHERLRILREAAEIHEREMSDKGAALAALAQSMPLSPRDRKLEDDVVRLARETGAWGSAVEGFRATAEAMHSDPHEVAHLRLREAEILERELGNPAEAYAAYVAAVSLEPDNLMAVQAINRIGTRDGNWDEVAAVVMAYTRARKVVEDSLFDELAAVADESGEWNAMVRAVAADLESGGELPPKVAFELYQRLGTWHRDQRDDRAAAIAAFTAALGYDPSQVDTVRALAALQKATPDRAYFDTLMRLVDSDPTNLDYVLEAAEVAAEHLGDAALARQTITTLLGRATAAWRGTAQAQSARSPEELVTWSLNKLVDDHVAGGNATAAIDLLVDGARMPFSTETRRDLRVRAAEIATTAGDRGAAIEMLRGVLAMTPEDAPTMDRLADLYRDTGKIAELMSLRQHELTLADTLERKLDLRLEVARLVGEVERIGGRVAALRQNLAESPGHEPSIEALCALLDSKSEHSSLAEMLEEQATKLEGLGANERAALLWKRVANVARHQLEDLDRAIEGFRRSVALVPAFECYDALAHLFVEKQQPGQAVAWLERCLVTAPNDDRSGIVLELANAHLAAGQAAQAITALESYLGQVEADATGAPELRALLADLYRQSESWEPLARLLTRTLAQVTDDDVRLAHAQEAAQIYADRLGMHDKAIPALERALELNPDDRVLRTQLAIGMRIAGRLEDARIMLTSLIEGFGRRKSAERAGVHVELALVARAEDQSTEALQQLELASKMDAGNPRILKMVADLYMVNGQPEDAERTYRALLLLVRRQPPGDDIETVGSSEVLYELHKIAAARGDGDQARELLESALEAATKSDAEVRRLRRSLDAHGDAEVLLQALQLRLESATESESRANLLTDIAEVLDSELHRSADALDAQLEAIDLIPDRMELHERAQELSRKAGQVDRYVECVDRTVDKLRRKRDAPVVATLLMKAGLSLEDDAGDLGRALAIYQRVEQSGERVAEALFAIARVTGVRGDDEERTRALDKLLELATGGESSPAKTDALYRMAGLFVDTPDRCEQGVDLLAQAFTAEPRYPEAGRVLQRAATAEPGNARVMTLYERVARGSGDWEMLLDFLERRARLAGTSPAEVKEAVDLAVEHDQPERGEALLERAVDAARQSDEGIATGIWAVIALAEQKIAAGELETARDLWFEIVDLADPDRIAELGLVIAGRGAAEPSHHELAAQIFETLRERTPAARHVWEPLVTLYRQMGATDRVQATIGSTLPNLVDPALRNALRIQHATHLLESVGDSASAIEVLRDLLLDDPDHLEGAALLEGVLRDSDDREGLADFLWQRFEDAKDRRNPDTVTDVAMRLGALLGEMGSYDAPTVYRQALEVAPDSRQLLEAVLRHADEETDARERAALMERQLAVTTDDTAPALTNELASLYESVGDEDGVQRTLELGFNACPADDGIRQRLETWYRDRQLWRLLAAMMAADAERLSDTPVLAVARLREAAEVHREMLHDAASAAVLLQQARALTPSNEGLVADLVGALLMAGDRSQAMETLTETLGAELEDQTRVNLLMWRADLRSQIDELGGAVEDLEEAYLLDREQAAEMLIAGLESYRTACQATGQAEGERAATLRLGELMVASGQLDQARDLVTRWIEREPRDRDALYFLRDLGARTEDWGALVMASQRLVAIEEGTEQIDAVLQLADAAEKANRPDAAREGLEEVHRQQPGAAVVRDKLRHIYELSGAYHELATLLLRDGDHGEVKKARYAAYRKAAEVFLMSLGDPASAMEPAQKALDLEPEDHDATTLYADVLTAAGRLDDAIAVLDPAIANHKRRSPELAALQQRMARISAAQGDQEGHLGWLKKAFDVDRKNGEIAAELAQLATQLGDYDLALKPLRAITLMDDPGPITRQMALLWEAKIEHARGNHAKAELWAKKALREDPDYAEAQQFLQEITS